MLRFDVNGLTNEILRNLEVELEHAFVAWEFEVSSKVTHGLFGGKTHPKVSHSLKIESDKIIGYLKANTYVLAESYGTGSYMLSDNPGLKDYMKSITKQDGAWNPARRGKAIVGRKQGSYVNLFGQRRTTSGAFEGQNIEGKRVYTRKKDTERDYYISPTKPSYAVQLANNWLWKTYLPKAYELAIKKVNFSKYLIES